jgi:hypothetical protein
MDFPHYFDVQLVIGSFLSDGKEPDLNLTPGRLMYSAFAPSSSLFRGTLSHPVAMDAHQILLARLSPMINQAFPTSPHGNELSKSLWGLDLIAG